MNLKKLCILLMMIYVILAVSFYYIAGDNLQYSSSTTAMVGEKAITGELLAGQTLTQSFRVKTNTIESISVKGATYERKNDDTITFSILDHSGKLLSSQRVETTDLINNDIWRIVFDKPIDNVRGANLLLSISSDRGTKGNSVTFYYGDYILANRVKVGVEDSDLLRLNNYPFDGILCYSVTGTDYYWIGQHYWEVALILGLILLLYSIYSIYKQKKGGHALLMKPVTAIIKYRFLITQLVSRDFKTKYKRSILGVFWSFLNPLLTMAVQYIVFATIFKTTIEYYPVYLLTGIICISFFMETCSLCLTSVTGNAFLMMKVYIPKYVFPFSRTLSSGINFLISLVPLFIVLLLSGLRINISFLLIPFGILCLFLFCLGIGLLLATSMVFFRDTQFIWGVLSTLWMYLTPIFYPESIIPEKFILFFKMNPLYHIIRYFRIILIDGVSPEPRAYLFCLIAAVLPFIIGVVVFKKNQDRFILFI